jgi:hypothetical protein
MAGARSCAWISIPPRLRRSVRFSAQTSTARAARDQAVDLGPPIKSSRPPPARCSGPAGSAARTLHRKRPRPCRQERMGGATRPLTLETIAPSTIIVLWSCQWDRMISPAQADGDAYELHQLIGHDPHPPSFACRCFRSSLMRAVFLSQTRDKSHDIALDVLDVGAQSVPARHTGRIRALSNSPRCGESLAFWRSQQPGFRVLR